MIGKLSGTLLEKRAPYVMIETAGIGYEIRAPMSSFYNLPDIGQPTQLYIHTQVASDAISLFGFSSHAERDLFRRMIRVNGVGPQVALAILSGMTCDDVITCIGHADHAALIAIPGIGKKTAERLILELRDKVTDSLQLPTGPRAADVHAEAQAALQSLGYRAQEAAKMVRSVPAQATSTEEIIRLALKTMRP